MSTKTELTGRTMCALLTPKSTGSWEYSVLWFRAPPSPKRVRSVMYVRGRQIHSWFTTTHADSGVIQ